MSQPIIPLPRPIRSIPAVISPAPILTTSPAAPILTTSPATPILTASPATPILTASPAAPVVAIEEIKIKETTGSKWFKVFVFIVSGFTLAIAITNAVWYNRIRNGACNALTQKEAETGFWINVFLAFISGILFIWAIARLFLTSDYRRA